MSIRDFRSTCYKLVLFWRLILVYPVLCLGIYSQLDAASLHHFACRLDDWRNAPGQQPLVGFLCHLQVVYRFMRHFWVAVITLQHPSKTFNPWLCLQINALWLWVLPWFLLTSESPANCTRSINQLIVYLVPKAPFEARAVISKDALCSFWEENLIRRKERSSLTIFFSVPKQTK